MTPPGMLPPIDAQPQFNAAGATQSPSQPTAPNPEVTEIANTIRTIIGQLGDLSSRLPDARPQFEVAAKALTEASLLAIQLQQPPEMPVPVTGA